jgi:hypothetical protein
MLLSILGFPESDYGRCTLESNSLAQVKKLILASGTDDWVHILEPLYAACKAMGGASESEALPLAVTAIKELVREGLVEVGELGSDGFEPWDGSWESIEKKLDLEVRKAEFPVPLGRICWTANTARGHEIGKKIVENEPEISDD